MTECIPKHYYKKWVKWKELRLRGHVPTYFIMIYSKIRNPQGLLLANPNHKERLKTLTQVSAKAAAINM